MLIIWSERRGNAVKKAKRSLWLHKLKVDALTVQSFNVAIRPKF